ncbi:related to DNA primase large chain [Cephalotrichum gorgonifer]|uniref:DNA primase large subunit n=1 Tax=Cephalotrichum gorgonifer TaxID=2041049 RepID=A0AAE8MTV4_9PEZI|nr:related to DNA primase large chain [Cephalotrichum gorgonifer]
MHRPDYNRYEPKRRNVLDHRKKQFADPAFSASEYPHRLNFYTRPPTADIKLEEFEQWAIDRLKGMVTKSVPLLLGELEACSFRNITGDDLAAHMKTYLDKSLPLSPDTAPQDKRDKQRQKDHYSHFILRLAFSSTEDLRRRFTRVETTLFRLRLESSSMSELNSFVRGLGLDWFETVTEKEKTDLREDLAASLGGRTAVEDEVWVKVDWMKVPDLVEGRRVVVYGGKAFVPGREQTSMIVAEFARRLEQELELTARRLPRLDEDDRLSPILAHLSKNFITPDSAYTNSTLPEGAEISARNIDTLSEHYPACMSNLHRALRRDAHLKHFGRLQYTLFLKGIGLNLEECLIFWRTAFSKITDDTFNKEYRYNVRHTYGDVGGDANRRGGGYSPYSCQKILTEHPPGSGEAHGCPYRHFDMDNLTNLLQGMGVTEKGVLQGVKEDRDARKYHMACNRVFEHVHKQEIKKARDESIMTGAQLETIVHPNEYFKRSYLLKNLDKSASGAKDVKMEG